MLQVLASLGNNIDAIKDAAKRYMDLEMPFLNKSKGKSHTEESKAVKDVMEKLQGKAFAFGAKIEDVESRDNPFELRRRPGKSKPKDPLAKNIQTKKGRR